MYLSASLIVLVCDVSSRRAAAAAAVTVAIEAAGVIAHKRGYTTDANARSPLAEPGQPLAAKARARSSHHFPAGK